MEFAHINTTEFTGTNESALNCSNFPEQWFDLWGSWCDEEPIDLDAFETSDLLASRRSKLMVDSIIRRTNGTISGLASICLVLHILRSRAGLSSTYHRLVFGLSISDIISSFAHGMSSTFVPKELEYYMPYAKGNTASCDAQGFLILLGYAGATLYNSTICLYYLSIIRYNKKDDYIKSVLEPWFHAVPIVSSFFISVLCLSMKGFNWFQNSTVCFIAEYDPPHCIGYDFGKLPPGDRFKIPCGRGGKQQSPIVYKILGVVRVLVLAGAPSVIVVAMVLMYRSVSKIEQNLQRYGAHALETDDHPVRNQDSDADGNGNGSFCRLKVVCSSMLSTCLCRDLEQAMSRRKRKKKSKKRAVLYMATGYTLAWFFVFVPYIIIAYYSDRYALEVVNAFCSSLQGVYNFLVFMSPKVRGAKRSGQETLSWRQAFVRAYMGNQVKRSTSGENKAGGKCRTAA